MYFLNKIATILKILVLSMLVEPVVTETTAVTDIQIDEITKKHKKQFYDELNKNLKSDNVQESSQNASNSNSFELQRGYYPIETYKKMIEAIETQSNKSNDHTVYHLIRNYEVFVVGDSKRLIKKREKETDPILVIVPFEDVFDALYRCHKAIGHKGRDLMRAQVNKSYANLTVKAITSNLIFKYL